MSVTYQIIRGLLVLAVAGAGICWFLWRWLKNSRDPALLLFRWIITVPLVAALIYAAIVSRGYFEQGSFAALLIVFYAWVGGLVMAIIWVPVITSWLGGLFGSLFDGGNEEADAKPFYSAFRSKRIKGQYFEALQEVRRQLARFPNDFEGQMLLAALQAENMDDLPGAVVTVDRICAQPEHSPKDIFYALNQLADWHLNLAKDRDSARAVLEKVIELMPESEMALRASQRIGHLADTDMLLASHDRKLVNVKAGVQNLGLQRGENGRLRAPEIDQEKLAAEYVEQLERHPLDTHAREKLATIYAKHYQRLDLAADQMEQMIQQPGHSARQVVGWLNLLADMQVAAGANYETVAATLQRIIQLYPDSASAQTTQRRLDRVKLEIKANEKTPEKVLGVYEQNLGLKMKKT